MNIQDSMKRGLSDSGDVDTLSNFRKVLLENGENLFQEELSKIASRHIDTEKMAFHVRKQSKYDSFTGQILNNLDDSITHILAKTLFDDMQELCEKLSCQLGDNKFYIYLSMNHEDFRDKSNIFLAVMAIARSKKLAVNFVDFICGYRPLYTNQLDLDVKNFVYLDDVTFYGNQMKENTCRLSMITSPEFFVGVSLHIIVPYINPAIMTLVMEDLLDFGKVRWYSTTRYPKPIHSVVHDLVVKNPNKEFSDIFKRVAMLLKTNYKLPIAWTITVLYGSQDRRHGFHFHGVLAPTIVHIR